MTRIVDSQQRRTTLAADLEHQRLTFRARRLERVVATLHARGADRADVGVIPLPLAMATAHFTRVLTSVRTCLEDAS